MLCRVKCQSFILVLLDNLSQEVDDAKLQLKQPIIWKTMYQPPLPRCVVAAVTVVCIGVTPLTLTLSRLPRLMNRKFVDEFAVEFCMTMNTKANRKKLVQALFSVDKNRYEGV